MEANDRIALGVFLVAVVATLALVGYIVADERDHGPGTAIASTCGQTIERGVLPGWARTGFSEKQPRIAHVLGREGELAAILFGDPLTAPPSEKRSNKILWVARRTPPPGPLELKATNGSRTINRVIETGPGPSGVDLPAGCWHIDARWPGGRDELDLTYVKG